MDARAQPPSGSGREPKIEVIVQATRPVLKHAVSDPTAASTVIEGEALRGAGMTSAQVLMRAPGVQVARTGAQADLATASIRGSDSAQVPVYVAGIRINDDISGTADLSTVPLWMMDRVEIFRGNAPENADRSGMGGAIFFWPRLPRTARVGASAELGSFGERGGWVAGESGSPTAGALVGVRRNHADNDYLFENDAGQRFDGNERIERRRNADFTATEAWGIARFRPTPQVGMTAVVNAFEREQGLTGPAAVLAERARGTVRRLLLGLSTRIPCGRAHRDCRIELQNSFLSAGLDARDPADELTALRTSRLRSQGERTVHRGRVAFRVHSRVELGASLMQSFENLRVDRQANRSRRGNRASTRLGTTLTWNATDTLTLYGLAALACHTTDGVTDRFNVQVVSDGAPCSVLEPTGRIGASYQVTAGVTLLANAGRYVRVPTLAELYGTSTLVEGNPELEPETGLTGDIGIRAQRRAEGHSGAYAIDSFLFARRADELIRYRRASLQSAAPFNVGQARVIGIEVAAGAEWLGSIKLEGSVTLLDPRETTPDPLLDPTPNDILPFTPRLVAAPRIEVFAEPGLRVLAQDRVALSLGYFHRASRYQDSAGQTVLPPQNLVDVEASTLHLERRLIARCAMRNAFNSRQLDVIGLPLPGRSFHAELEAWW